MTTLESKFVKFVSTMSNTMKPSNVSKSFVCPICNNGIHSLFIRRNLDGSVNGNCHICGYSYKNILEKYKDSK